MKEQEPKLVTMAAVVKHCRGETWVTVPANILNGVLAGVQLNMAIIHDKMVHQKDEPCKKSFYTRF